MQRLASPRTALVAGGVWLLLLVVTPLLAYRAHQLGFESLASGITSFMPFGLVGAYVAYRQPRNPIGWLLLALGIGVIFSADAGFYAVMRYRLGYHGLPLGRLAVALVESWVVLILAMPLPLVLFPHGRLPSPRWRYALWTYLAAGAVFVATQAWLVAPVFSDRRVRIDSSGEYTAVNHASGAVGVIQTVVTLPYLAFWLLGVGRLVVGYRRSTGAERQQWKWLLSGGAVSMTGLFVGLQLGGSSGFLGVVAGAAFLAIIALPVSIGVAILRYRLYEIDRIVSRTLGYAILTGLLVAIYLGVVTVATRALPLSSPVAVAASTLAAAALFNPLRRRVQHLVDRRFNRARYDAEAVIDAFARTLRDAIDLDSVRDDLIGVIGHTVHPTHATLWLRATAGSDPAAALRGP